MYNDTVYQVRNILILPEAQIQLTLNDGTAVHFPYRSPQWTEFVWFLHGHTNPPTANRWDKVRYLNVRNQLLQLYKVPRNFLRAAITQADRVPPVPVPPTTGRPG